MGYTRETPGNISESVNQRCTCGTTVVYFGISGIPLEYLWLTCVLPWVCLRLPKIYLGYTRETSGNISESVNQGSTCGTPVVYLWYTCGIPLVYLWYTSGIPLVNLWFTLGLPQVNLRSTRSIPEVYL